jgi:polyphosphate kinase
MALDTDRAFPLLRNLTLHLAVRLAPAKGSRKPRFAVFPLEPALDRLVRVPSLESFAYLLIEDVVKLFLESLCPDERIMECQPFRITRNADMSVQEDLAPDLLKGMLDVLDARREGACVRLEIAETATQRLRNFLQSSLALRSEDIYAIPGPIDLAFLSSLADLQDHDELKYEAWPPQPSPAIDPALSMVENVAKRDILLQHPYEHFDPVVRLMDEAADDPQVMAIKQILYRTSYNSPIVTALRRAARKGKYVTVIVELKARFDEARNIEWAQAMERDGVQVIYGIKGLKTHAKLTIIVRRDPEGVRRYLHIGTGNYNEATARLYSDTSYFTCDEDLGTEASIFFNTITGFSQPRSFHFIAAAPLGLRDRILELIEAERAFKKQRQKALIVAKLNALVDPDIIQALYGASQEGVEIRLNVRGICCLRPQVPGISENITVTSIVDRYLEHSRIFYFHHGGEERLYLSSADWMPRNLDRRIELLVPVRDKRCCGKLLDILNVYLDDNVKAQRLLPDGSHERVMAVGRRKRVRSQEALYDKICQSVKKRFKQRPVSFKPHRPTADE